MFDLSHYFEKADSKFACVINHFGAGTAPPAERSASSLFQTTSSSCILIDALEYHSFCLLRCGVSLEEGLEFSLGWIALLRGG